MLLLAIVALAVQQQFKCVIQANSQDLGRLTTFVTCRVTEQIIPMDLSLFCGSWFYFSHCNLISTTWSLQYFESNTYFCLQIWCFANFRVSIKCQRAVESVEQRAYRGKRRRRRRRILLLVRFAMFLHERRWHGMGALCVKERCRMKPYVSFRCIVSMIINFLLSILQAKLPYIQTTFHPVTLKIKHVVGMCG